MEIRDPLKYEKAFEVLLKMGGAFSTRPTQVLVVTESQYRALVDAGVLRRNSTKGGGRGKRARKKANV